MAQRHTDEALEKLNRGIEESRRTIQHQTMGLAQEYFGDSVEELKQQIEESRSTLEDLPDQMPGGQDESFRLLFQELMDNYSDIERCLDEAEARVAGLDTEKVGARAEPEATDAARHMAGERGMDLSEVEGTGDEGRVIAEDVRSDEERQVGRPEATDAAWHEARKRGIDLSKVEATGAEGQIIVSDVVESAQRAGEGTGDSAGRTMERASRAAARTQEARTALQGQLPDGRAADDNSIGEYKATNAARRKAEELGVDLSRFTGTGSGGQITVADVTGFVEDDRGAVGRSPEQSGTANSATGRTADGEVGRAQEATRQTDVSGGPLATNAARHRAEKLGVDLSRIRGSGANGLITLKDVRRMKS